ncbi:hypothetical protein H5410_017378 [Solanum commersonii]|uniref:Uncharacterized protein n=1 Tax=Solanum commersonii TaxID=4109 RepID=A0A9J5ZZT8_SOLCO|nr:hypothetical protein H5410_017378 [Solanum commersonii]
MDFSSIYKRENSSIDLSSLTSYDAESPSSGNTSGKNWELNGVRSARLGLKFQSRTEIGFRVG